MYIYIYIYTHTHTHTFYWSGQLVHTGFSLRSARIRVTRSVLAVSSWCVSSFCVLLLLTITITITVYKFHEWLASPHFSPWFVWLASETTSDRECLSGGRSLDTPVGRISKSQIGRCSRAIVCNNSWYDPIILYIPSAFGAHFPFGGAFNM